MKNKKRKILRTSYLHKSLMMMMNCFLQLVGRRKAFSLISSRDHCQRSSSSRISDTSRAGFEPVQNLSSGFVVVITTTPRPTKILTRNAMKILESFQRNLNDGIQFSKVERWSSRTLLIVDSPLNIFLRILRIFHNS